MKVPQDLVCLLEDAWFRCKMRSQVRDVATITQRLNHEGASFLTITLPKFLDDLMIAQEHGSVSSDLFVGWKKRMCLPAFLQGFTSKLINLTDGTWKDDADVQSLFCLRQILSFYKKEKCLCDERRVRAAYRDYERIEDDLCFVVQDLSWNNWQDFSKISRLVWSTVLGRYCEVENLIPKHGPGSTAERLKGNRKYTNFRWVKSLLPHFSPEYSMYSTEECAYLDDKPVSPLVNAVDAPAIVIAVPKTASKPRIICLEPISIQMCQQGLKDYLVDRLEQSSLTSGHINFKDQTVNQGLALSSSKTSEYATIDLSSASDRVHNDFVHQMLDVNPPLRELIMAARSTHVNLNGKLIKLTKFASMGSATCFPIESMFFYTLCVLGLIRSMNLPLTLSSVKRVSKHVYVYGDDIIVPVHSIPSVLRTLTDFGNVVGLKKSFYKGKFRESCGTDAYDGCDITPVYKRQQYPTRMSDQAAIISSVATANQLFSKGWYRTAEHVKLNVQQITGELPVSSTDLGGLAWSFGDTSPKTRYNRLLQRFEVQTLVVKPVYESIPVNNYQALFKCLSPRGVNHEHADTVERNFLSVLSSDSKHLERSPRRGAVSLKRRWVRAH